MLQPATVSWQLLRKLSERESLQRVIASGLESKSCLWRIRGGVSDAPRKSDIQLAAVNVLGIKAVCCAAEGACIARDVP